MTDRQCSIEGCEKNVKASELCSMHYERKRKYGDPNIRFESGRPFPKGHGRTQPDECIADGCTATPFSGGRCKRHYSQWRRSDEETKRRDLEQDYARRRANPEKYKAIGKRSHEKHRTKRNDKTRKRREQFPNENHQYFLRDQAETLENATRRGYEWGGWELELVADPNRTAKSVALELGRTLSAVRLMRHKVRHDPQTIARVDLSSDGTL